MMPVKNISGTLTLALGLLFTDGSQAQIAGKPITMIVPVSPGTAVDTLARQIQLRLSQKMSTTVVIDNRTGASGAIGMSAVARAAPDGNTLLVSPSTMAMLNLTQKDLGWDAIADFQPVARLANAPYAVVVTPSLPVNNIKELLALARSKPGALNFASPGVGTPQHLVGELFKQATGIDVVHVSYKTTAGATTDLASGQVQFGFQAIIAVLPLVKAGKLRIIATVTETRTPWTPEIPTLRESGVDGVNINSWISVFLPKNTAREITERYSREIASIMNLPEVKEELLKSGVVVNYAGPEEMGTVLRRDMGVWKKVIDDGRIVMTP